MAEGTQGILPTIGVLVQMTAFTDVNLIKKGETEIRTAPISRYHQISSLEGTLIARA